MKVPPRSELRKLNTRLRASRGEILREVLRNVVSQWTRLSGDDSLEQAIRSWDIPRMIEISDALSAAVHADAATHFAAHQIAALIRKYPWTPKESKLDPEKTAIETFLASENRCKRVNQWFRAWNMRTLKNRPYAGAFEQMRRWIRYVIRDVPDLQSIYSKCDFTGGASLGVHGDATNLARKLLAREWSVTPSARPYLAAALCANPHYAMKVAEERNGVQCLWIPEKGLDACCSMVDYNKVAFVPKTAKTHRSIAVEPLGNNFLQKGVDEELRDFLRRVGLDLSDQSPNQEMARQGSFDGEDDFCTIDLSSASDSMSIGLVREVIPPEWFYFLNRLRSPSYQLSIDGGLKHLRYEKFVSMGNGFCFPLQTLLFASVVKAVNPAAKPGVDFRVYGDDIIVRKSIFASVVELLKVCGFVTNQKKTFGSGPFRESCGANWYSGEDVTPMTLKQELDSLENLFKFLNLARRNTRTAAFFEDVLPLVIRRIPDQFLFWRPFKGRPETGIDPAGLEFTPVWKRHSAWQCPVWLELHTSSVEDRFVEALNTSWVVMAAAMRGLPSHKPFTFRRKVETRIRRVASGVPETVPDVIHKFKTWNGVSLADRTVRQRKDDFLGVKSPLFLSRLPIRVE